MLMMSVLFVISVLRPRDSAVSIVTCYVLEDRGVGVQVLVELRSVYSSQGPGGGGGHALAYWLRHYATNRKVAGSIPDEAILKFA
jgi:hypothetical protein